jgi:feruloyl-CoA synthase
MLSAWGSTETSPLATSVHFPMERAGVIGLPVAGCELKLVPAAGKLEVRVRGPHVTPGYYQRPDLTKAAFDEEGFYRIGDAVKLADPADPSRGIVFDGRVAEDFKLSTGTWVSAGAVRVRLIAAADPLIQDAVITGHDRDEVGALVFLNPTTKDMSFQAVRSRLASVLKTHGAGGRRQLHLPARLLVMTEAPSIDANEITDKGYMNQRAVLERRAALVEELYRGGAEVIHQRLLLDPSHAIAPTVIRRRDLHGAIRLAEEIQPGTSAAIGSKLSAPVSRGQPRQHEEQRASSRCSRTPSAATSPPSR